MKADLLENGNIGKGDYHFSYPRGICLNYNKNDNGYGLIYISDMLNDRVVCYETDVPERDSGEIKFVRQFGSPGLFDQPACVMVDDDDGKEMVYIVDSGNHCIKQFGKDEVLINKWGHPGRDCGQLYFHMRLPRE